MLKSAATQIRRRLRSTADSPKGAQIVFMDFQICDGCFDKVNKPGIRQNGLKQNAVLQKYLRYFFPVIYPAVFSNAHIMRGVKQQFLPVKIIKVFQVIINKPVGFNNFFAAA